MEIVPQSEMELWWLYLQNHLSPLINCMQKRWILAQPMKENQDLEEKGSTEPIFEISTETNLTFSATHEKGT